MTMRDKTAIAGVGVSRFGRFPDESPLKLAVEAFKAALADAGLGRDEADGVAINIRWPPGRGAARVAGWGLAHQAPRPRGGPAAEGGSREGGGPPEKTPVYGMTAPAAGAALSA